MSTGAIHDSSQEDGMRPRYVVSFFRLESLWEEVHTQCERHD